MKKIAFILAAALLPAAASAPAFGATAAPSAPATPAAAPAPGALNTTDTDLGTLLDNPAAKAVLAKHIPEIIANEQIDMGRSMTLRQLQSYASEQITDEALAKIDIDLAKLPAK